MSAEARAQARVEEVAAREAAHGALLSALESDEPGAGALELISLAVVSIALEIRELRLQPNRFKWH